MTAQQKISGRILTYIANGATIKEAFDWVLGAGQYDCFVSDLYEALRAKGAQK